MFLAYPGKIALVIKFDYFLHQQTIDSTVMAGL